MRLDRFLSNNGFGSRKDVKKIIKSKAVTINNMVVLDPSLIINTDTDIVSVDNIDIHYKQNVYYMLNKPAGYESSHESDLYPTVFELIDDHRTDLIIVGRLDVDTEGLLIITNDGQFSHQVIHGKKEIYKQYYVELEHEFDTSFISQLEHGIQLDELTLKPAKVEMVSETSLLLSIAEGKYHQVKRMMHYCNNDVVYLKRVALGALKLDESLQLGEYRELTDDELKYFSA